MKLTRAWSCGLVLAALVSSTAFGCSSASDDDTSTTAQALGRASNTELWIAKRDLGSEFLIQANWVSGDLAPLGGGMQSRVVTFEKRGAELFMLWSSKGRTVLDKNQESILMKFPITKESGSKITFDFNTGANKVYLAGDWYAKDFQGPWAAPDASNLSINTSYLSEAKVQGSQFIVDQVAQVDYPYQGVNYAFPSTIRYYFGRYEPNPQFSPTESPPIERVGFFEVAPQLSEKGDVVYASKFDTSKPIEFSLSPRVPAEFKQAVTDGILYWEKALGRGAIKVVPAPEDVVAPDYNYNLVEWIPWRDAGFAYADAQLDPLTGEALHGQVWVMSAWGLIGQSEAQGFLRKLQTSGIGASRRPLKLGGAPKLNLRGFLGGSRCSLEGGAHADHLVSGLETALATMTTDDQVKSASQDLIRSLVAHEIGHVLGLRHNFAASSESTVAAADIPKVFADYVKSGSTPDGAVFASSVMDYIDLDQMMMQGDHIEKGQKALPYDQAAIDILYKHKSLNRETMPAFCTDSSLFPQKYTDCTYYDVGRSAIEGAHATKARFLAELPNTIIETFISARTIKGLNAGEAAKQPDEISFNATYMAYRALAAHETAFGMLTVDGRELKTSKAFAQFPDLGKLEEPELRAARVALIEKELAAIGGADALFALPDFQATAKARLDQLLASPEYTSGKGWDGKPFTFTAEEKEQIRTTGRKLIDALAQEMLDLTLTVLAGESLEPVLYAAFNVPYFGEVKAPAKLLAASFAKDLETAMYKAARAAFATTGATISATIQVDIGTPPVSTKKTVNLPVYRYPLTLRQKAMTLTTTTGRSEDVLFGNTAQTDFQAELDKLVMSQFGVTLAELGPQKKNFPTEVQRWITELEQIGSPAVTLPPGIIIPASK